MSRWYRLLWWLATPAVIGYLLKRSRKQPQYRRHWAERWALGDSPIGGQRPLIWIHAVSLGETRAAAPLVTALLREFTALAGGDDALRPRLLITQMTPTGRAAAQELFGDVAEVRYLPYDYGYCARRFVTCYRPALGVLLETELWPNLINACHAGGVPLALVNARLSQRSLQGYLRIAPVARMVGTALARLSWIGAQSDADAERLTQLLQAARPAASRPNLEVTGNLKFDVQPPAELLERGRQWRRRWAARFVLIAASTRDREEAMLLDAWRAGARDDWRLIIVPRHPQRFDQVAQLIAARGLRFARRDGADALGAAEQVLLGDSLGELPAYYGCADAAFVGGSLVPLGGQNLIEAAACGCAVIVGPHTFNFSAATDAAISAGAALRVDDAAGLMRAAAVWADDAQRLAQARAAALGFAESARGATERTVTRLMGLVDVVGGGRSRR